MVAITKVNGSPRPSSDASETTFLVKPYLQLGNVSPGRVADELVLLWHADLGEAVWAVSRISDGNPGSPVLAPPPTSHPDHGTGHRSTQAFSVRIEPDLVPGKEFGYLQVRKGGATIFGAALRPKGTGQPYRFVAFGDCAAGTAPQKAIAYQTYLARPDFVMITGDIVYSRGRISEYLEKFWPVYNADLASPIVGAPLLRSTLFVAAPGNHDIATRDLEKYPDSLAYFLYWDQLRRCSAASERPLSLLSPGQWPISSPSRLPVTPTRGWRTSRSTTATPTGLSSTQPTSTGPSPSFDATGRARTANAREHTWRFVAFHHPGFNSSKAHFNDQQMRLLAEVFELGRVDVVFSGHVHNYQMHVSSGSHPKR